MVRANSRCAAMPQPSSTPQAVVFRARGLSKVYVMGEIAVHALRDIDFDIYEGEFVVLLGPSGSGKSTLLNILGGLDAPSSGHAMWRDHDLVNAGDTELTRYRREHVGFVFQFYNLIPSLTVLENVALVNEIADTLFDPREALALVGLTERLDHFPSQLSGGEQQRVAVARAIAKSPDVLLCDEPTGALDYDTGKLVLAAIARVNETLGTTTVIITHNAAIAGMADRVLKLNSAGIGPTTSTPGTSTMRVATTTTISASPRATTSTVSSAAIGLSLDCIASLMPMRSSRLTKYMPLAPLPG